jgi:hypothetical protein
LSWPASCRQLKPSIANPEHHAHSGNYSLPVAPRCQPCSELCLLNLTWLATVSRTHSSEVPPVSLARRPSTAPRLLQTSGSIPKSELLGRGWCILFGEKPFCGGARAPPDPTNLSRCTKEIPAWAFLCLTESLCTSCAGLRAGPECRRGFHPVPPAAREEPNRWFPPKSIQYRR